MSDDSEIDDSNYDETTGVTLRSGFVRHAQLLQHFQHRWKRECLTSLQEQHRTTGKIKQSIKVGDIVLVHDDIPRNKWKVAVVEQLLQGADSRKQQLWRRKEDKQAYYKTLPLEVSSSSNKEATETEVPTISTATTDKYESHPTSSSATK